MGCLSSVIVVMKVHARDVLTFSAPDTGQKWKYIYGQSGL